MPLLIKCAITQKLSKSLCTSVITTTQWYDTRNLVTPFQKINNHSLTLVSDGMWGSICGFVLGELDSVQFHLDIIFCLESDSIVVSFSSSIGFLRVDIRQFWFQHITCYSFCIHGVFCFSTLTSEKWRVRELGSLRKSTKKPKPVFPT